MLVLCEEVEGQTRGAFDDLVKEIASLEADRDRLNWIEAQSNGCNWCARQPTTGRGFRLHNSETRTGHGTAREAIDAAISLPQGTPTL